LRLALSKGPNWIDVFFPPFYLRMETDSVSETSCSFKHRTMDTVQKPRNSLCYSNPSETTWICMCNSYKNIMWMKFRTSVICLYTELYNIHPSLANRFTFFFFLVSFPIRDRSMDAKSPHICSPGFYLLFQMVILIKCKRKRSYESSRYRLEDNIISIKKALITVLYELILLLFKGMSTLVWSQKVCHCELSSFLLLLIQFQHSLCYKRAGTANVLRNFSNVRFCVLCFKVHFIVVHQ
jgi:hypothetical protein